MFEKVTSSPFTASSVSASKTVRFPRRSGSSKSNIGGSHRIQIHTVPGVETSKVPTPPPAPPVTVVNPATTSANSFYYTHPDPAIHQEIRMLYLDALITLFSDIGFDSFLLSSYWFAKLDCSQGRSHVTQNMISLFCRCFILFQSIEGKLLSNQLGMGVFWNRVRKNWNRLNLVIQHPTALEASKKRILLETATEQDGVSVSANSKENSVNGGTITDPHADMWVKGGVKWHGIKKRQVLLVRMFDDGVPVGYEQQEMLKVVQRESALKFGSPSLFNGESIEPSPMSDGFDYVHAERHESPAPISNDVILMLIIRN